MAKKKDTAVSPETAIPTEEILPSSGEAQPAETPQADREDTQTPSGPESQPSEPVRAVVRAGNGLNLRAGPGPGFEARAVLPDGAEVSVLTLLAEGGPQGIFDFRVPGWKYVFTGEMVGWVNDSFLDLPEAGHGKS